MTLIDDIRSRFSTNENFTAMEVRERCPDWKPSTYSTFLAKHCVDNPGGYTEFFERVSKGVYRLRQ